MPLGSLCENDRELSQSEVVLYLPLNCNICGVIVVCFLFVVFVCSWDDLLENVREANVNFFKNLLQKRTRKDLG